MTKRNHQSVRGRHCAKCLKSVIQELSTRSLELGEAEVRSIDREQRSEFLKGINVSLKVKIMIEQIFNAKQ